MENKWQAFESATQLAIARDVALRRYSSLGIGGFAAGALTAESEQALEKIWRTAESLGIVVKMLGGGTNVVFTDDGFDGLLVRLGENFKKIEARTQTSGSGLPARPRGRPPPPLPPPPT